MQQYPNLNIQPYLQVVHHKMISYVTDFLLVVLDFFY